MSCHSQLQHGGVGKSQLRLDPALTSFPPSYRVRRQRKRLAFCAGFIAAGWVGVIVWYLYLVGAFG